MHDTILIVFTGILAIAVLAQTILFFGIYRAIRQLAEKADGIGKDLLRNIELVSAKVDEGLASIKGIADGMKPIQQKLTVTTDLISKRAADIDLFLAETTENARMELRRIQDAIHSAIRRVEQTFDLIHDRISAPLNEVSAVTQAVRVGLDVLFRRRRNPSGSAQDEEMFI